jgi:hypothetical protein
MKYPALIASEHWEMRMEKMDLGFGNEYASLEMPGPEPEWHSRIYIAYIALRVGSFCTQ